MQQGHREPYNNTNTRYHNVSKPPQQPMGTHIQQWQEKQWQQPSKPF